MVLIELGSTRAKVDSNSPQFLQDVATMYRSEGVNRLHLDDAVVSYYANIDQGVLSRHELWQDHTMICQTSTCRELLARLEWSIAAHAISALSTQLLIHAGVVAARNQALLLPAASRSGKTTLVAALMASGFHCLSDEVAVIDPRLRSVMPFAKPLCLRRGAWEGIQATTLGRTAVPALRSPDEPVWYVAPFHNPPAGSRYQVSHIVSPHYDPAATSQLIPISRGTALTQLIEQSFNLSTHRYRGLEALTRLVKETECYRLVVNDLEQATELLRRLIS